MFKEAIKTKSKDVLNRPYQQKKTKHTEKIETEFVTKKQCPYRSHCFLLSYVFKLL